MLYKKNWEETKIKFQNYWEQKNTGTPLMRIVAEKPGFSPFQFPDELKSKDMYDKYQDAERIVERFRYYCETHEFLAESFPNLSADFGPGSIAAYLGSDIVFNRDTVWFTEWVEDWEEVPKLEYSKENQWYQKHIELVKKCKELAGDDFPVCIPDLMENVDVLASLRGAQDMIFDMVDEPEEVLKRVQEVTELYKHYYDDFYDVVKYENGSAYTVFQIYGEGKTAKLQCDFSAMMSPDHFKEFVVDSLKQQCENLDHVLYHLDGPDAIKHLDAVLEVEGIDALQWTSGDYGPDGTYEEWDVIYDKARRAGKSLWLRVYTGEYEDWIRNTDRIVQKYGSHSLFIFFPDMTMEQAENLIAYANEHWCDVQGTFDPQA